MRWARPKSLSGLMLVGLALIAVPLLVAILTAVLQIRYLADTGTKIVIQGVAGARASQALFGQIASLERTARLYDVLADPKLLELYRTQDERLSTTREQLHSQATSDARSTLEEIGVLQRSLRNTVMSAPPGNSAAVASDLSSRFTQLSALVERVAQQSNAQVDMQVAALAEQTLQARKRLLWQTAPLLPLAVVAVFVLTLGVGRPLRQLDRAISELGQGTFTNPIAVTGPHDLERLGGQLEWLRQRLLELAHERNRFLRHISHELKTPLANIREGTELLMDGAVGELDSNQREVTAILRESGIKLQRMIENLLSFSAWQTSSVGLEATEFRLRPLVKQVLENQQLTLLSQRVRLDVRVEDVTLVADRGKIRLILENLVSNAVKYSPKGGTIHLRARATAAQLVLDVADNGPGIPPEERGHVFDAFYTGRAARSTAVKGTGIGLSVVLEFVAAHGGTVQIVDGEFPGAHFRITMPIKATSGDRPARREPKAHAHAA
ncbi:MAG: HAMP domain-containing histidine kinase [Gammaproteobacteria bacterium]|nr:MAG: HAMP domain-containing histidine kinase [Gammaproteobacteria bacterium]TLY87232.1 MAG: HAMP domain-containing histidine kinase [Gammaproteobacteria bacterium]